MSNYRPIRTHANLQDLFNRTVRNANGCMEWQNATDGHNYGQIRINSKNQLVHRLVCELIYGKPLTKLNALHSCDNSLCINPDHLRWGSQSENMLEKVAKNRHHDTSGENSSHAKLTWVKVAEIRALYGTGEYTHRSLAALFNVTHAVIGKIIRNQGWIV